MSALHILIVDDSAMMRAVIKRALQQTNLDIGVVLEASHGREALEVLDREPVDAVLTDINMPVMNGIELLREIDARDPEHLLRIVVSTDGSTMRREEARELGVSAYIEKPFQPEVVRGVFDEFLRARASAH
jgi:two-component system chemotaxis response regulator CheY